MVRRWRPIAERPALTVETAMIRCRDSHDTYLMPGPVRWDGGEWVAEDTGRGILYQPGAEYHWCSETELLKDA